MGLVPICRLSNAFNPCSLLSLSPCLCPGLSAGAAAQNHLKQEQSLGGFCPCAAQEGRRDADPGDCVSLNPSFHCSKAFA